MEPVRITFVISDFELDTKTCARCQTQQRKHSFLSLPRYCAQLLRVVLQTLCNLRSFYCSPERFRGHLCWNFVLTTSEQIVNSRNLSQWYEFRREDIEKLRDYIYSKANTCSCLFSRNNEDVRLRVPFEWGLISTSIRNCLTQGRWSDRIAVTPKKFALDSSRNQNTNHIVILGGLPGQADIVAEFDGQNGVERLMQRLLLIDGAPSGIGDQNRTVQSAASVFGKKRVCLSVVAFEAIESLVITPKQKKYAYIVHKAMKRISKGSFTWAPFVEHRYWSEITQMADHTGILAEKYFSVLSRERSDDCDNRQILNVEWLYNGQLHHGFCVATSRADSAKGSLCRTERMPDSPFTITDVTGISKVPTSWLFSLKTFCFGYAESSSWAIPSHFTGNIPTSPTDTIKPVRKVLVSFLPHCRCFAILYADGCSAPASQDTVDHNGWLTRACRLEQPAYYTKHVSDRLLSNWRESLVPTLTEHLYVQSASCRSNTACHTLYNCSPEEAIYEYKKHFKRLLGGSAAPEGNVSDTIQRALLTAGVKLKDFLRDEQLWYGPAQFSKVAKLAYSGCNEDANAALKGLSATLHFQFETALVLGELENVRTPPLGLQDENQSVTSNNFEDSVFEIVNLLRWAVGRYPEAATSANRCLQKRVRAGCRFAESVYAELRRDALHPLAECSKENQAPAVKRRSLPARCSGTSLLDEYKNYAKRYAAASTVSNSLRFVNMRADDWAAVDDRCFVPDTPDSSKVKKPTDDDEFSISETPAKAVGSSVPVTSERQALSEQSSKKRAEKIRRLRQKLKKVRREKALCKTPAEIHAHFSKELHYHRKLNVLTKASHVKRQLFPEYGQWYSSEESGSSEDTNSREEE